MSDELMELNEFDKIERQRKRALATALDQSLNEKGTIFAQKVNMGFLKSDTGIHKLVPSYTTVQSLDEIASKIKMGSDMPFMQDKIDPKTQKLIIDEENIKSVMQRAPDWTRQIALTAYLLSNRNHKFTSILAVIEPEWINNPKDKNWGDDGRALKNSIEFEALDSSGSIGLINISNQTIFALDGQHRIMGIKGVQELISGQIFYLTKNKKQKGDPISKSDFFKMIKAEETDLRKILNETMSIEFIPAVIKGETRDEARARLRSYFVSINKNAKKISKGEGDLLDEDDGYKVVAKELALEHPLFKDPSNEKHRINMQDQALPASSNWISTIVAINNMSEKYLSQSKIERNERWKGILNGKISIRPPEDELAEATKEFRQFLDIVNKLTIFQKINRGGEVKKLREFPSEKNPDFEGHLLMRPIGQQILADAVGRMVSNGWKLDDIYQNLEKIDQASHFNTFNPSSIFYGITYDFNKKGMITDTTTQDRAADYLVYLLHGELEVDELQNYIDQIVSKRSLFDENEWINFEGNKESNNNVSYNKLPERA
jgi:hypothetical protein